MFFFQQADELTRGCPKRVIIDLLLILMVLIIFPVALKCLVVDV